MFNKLLNKYFSKQNRFIIYIFILLIIVHFILINSSIQEGAACNYKETKESCQEVEIYNNQEKSKKIEKINTNIFNRILKVEKKINNNLKTVVENKKYIKKITNLVNDIRGNGGGEDYDDDNPKGKSMAADGDNKMKNAIKNIFDMFRFGDPIPNRKDV